MQGIIVGRACTFLLLFLKIATLFCLHLKVSKWNACPPNDSLFSVLLGIPVEQCVDECTRRPSCDAIGYKRSLQLCQLHANSSTADISDRQCLIIRREDMIATEECGCGDWDVCVKDQNTCSKKECQVLGPLGHGRYLGNVNMIGARKRVLCDYCYTWSGESNVLECMENGRWSQNITCNLIDCGELPMVDNGNLTLDTIGNTTCGATATLSCDPWYVSSKDKIACQSSGKWQEPVIELVCPSGSGELNLTDIYRIKFVQDTFNHTGAVEACEQMNGGLLKLDEPWKIKLLFYVLTRCQDYTNKTFWIDGELEDGKSNWHFADGRTIVPDGLIQWYPGRPRLMRFPRCLQLMDAQWRDRRCSTQRTFRCICELSLHGTE